MYAISKLAVNVFTAVYWPLHKVVCALQETANVCLIMELVTGGNLHQRIKDTSRARLSYMEILQVRLPT